MSHACDKISKSRYLYHVYVINKDYIIILWSLLSCVLGVGNNNIWIVIIEIVVIIVITSIVMICSSRKKSKKETINS